MPGPRTSEEGAIDARTFTFGIEEEFFLAHPRSGNVVARVPALLLKSCRKRFGELVGREMLQSQIEISSPVFDSCAQARAEMTRLRRGVAEIAASLDLRLVASGTHPLAAWHEQVHTAKPRYERLIDDFQIVGRRNLLCGLHVHVAVPAGVDRVDVMNRAVRWLPLFLALSTSSPFWNRQRTGLLSYRQAAYDEWPRTGIPDFHADEAEYRRFIDLLVRNGAIAGPGSVWWAIRPAERYPTLELRIADACTHLDDSLAIAALYRCLVRALVRQPELGRDRGALTRRVVDENRWRAKRWGMEASVIDERGGAGFSFVRWLDELRALVAEDAQALGCADALRHLGTIVARGTSAHEQLAIYRDRRDAGATRLEAARAVVDWLVEASVPA